MDQLLRCCKTEHVPAWVLTLTDASFLIQVVACRTFTLETAKGVNADSTLAETRQLLALIDIWGRVHTVTLLRPRCDCSRGWRADGYLPG